MKQSIILTTILGLYFTKTAISSEVEGNLRGGDDRDLLTMGGATSKSLSYSWTATEGSDSFCFDFRKNCFENGWPFAYSDSDTYVSGNAGAWAETDVELGLFSICSSFAIAYAQTCAIYYADGKVNVNTNVLNNNKNVALDVALKTVTMTLAIAESKAYAQSIAAVGAYTYTDIAAYCSKVNNKSIYCAGGDAQTKLKQLAVARAGSIGQAGATASSGSVTATKAAVWAGGSSVNYVNGFIASIAKSWSFASAGAAASALAAAYTEACNESFMEVCATEHQRSCNSNSGIGFCNENASVACARAWTLASVYAGALADSCASAFASSLTGIVAVAGVSANVDCSGSSPKLTWTCEKSYTDVTCNV